MMQKRRGRRDRIAAEEHLEASKLRTRDEAKRQRFGARDRAVEARLRGSGVDMVLVDTAELDRLAISVAGVERGDVGFGQLRSLGELGVQPVDDRLPVSCMPSPLSPAKRTTTASDLGCEAASSSVMRWVAVATCESLQTLRVSCSRLL
jgi:hypothetical protein